MHKGKKIFTLINSYVGYIKKHNNIKWLASCLTNLVMFEQSLGWDDPNYMITSFLEL